MGLADWFSTFCSNIQVQDGGTISARYKAITRRLNTDFWSTTYDTSHSLYVGSYGRNTAIQGFSDLDMIFQLPYSVYEKYSGYIGNGQSALLQAVKASIEKTYQRRAFEETVRSFKFHSQMELFLRSCPVSSIKTTAIHIPTLTTAVDGAQRTRSRKSRLSGPETTPAMEILPCCAG